MGPPLGNETTGPKFSNALKLPPLSSPQPLLTVQPPAAAVPGGCAQPGHRILRHTGGSGVGWLEQAASNKERPRETHRRAPQPVPRLNERRLRASYAAPHALPRRPPRAACCRDSTRTAWCEGRAWEGFIGAACGLKGPPTAASRQYSFLTAPPPPPSQPVPTRRHPPGRPGGDI